MPAEFTHLHNHTEYSLLDGLSNIPALVARASELGMKSLAITDHGGLYGAVEFYKQCKEFGINPIIGLESYLAQESRHSKTPADKTPYHLLLLAKNPEGYSNLLKIASVAHLEGFYYKPRVDKEFLAAHSRGLIALSGCPSAEIPRLIIEGRIEDAQSAAIWYRDTFEDFFLEIQRHTNIPELPNINEKLQEISVNTGIPLVATNDCHYIEEADAPIQDLLVCIHTNTNIYDENRLKMSDESYYLKSPQEMIELFKDIPDAIDNTNRIAEMCHIELDFDQLRLPEYSTPDGKDAYKYLSDLCYEGLRRRYHEPSSEEYSRLEYELDVIEKTQFPNYFLVVWDIARFARDNKILFGVRGSAAASLALYCLGVTDIDPLKYRLVFERFLNLERREMPDIDMDFQDDRREEVITYMTKKYGSGHVAQIITFGTLGAKAAIRDTGRALGLPYSEVDRVARLIPNKINNLRDALEDGSEIRELFDNDNKLRNLIENALRLEGVTRHSSTHAAGVVISGEPLVNYVPLQRPSKGALEDMAMTQYPMDPIAKLGLLKMDILGLTNLSTIEEARRIISIRRGVSIDLYDIDLEDKPTFDLLSSGETTGVFQLESSGMRRYIQKLKPSSIGDIAAMIALYRPGPMEHIDTFIDAKHGKIAPKYPHEALKKILEETYGVIVYQDQVLLIAQAFAGYSLGEADVVRKAMGKKIPEVMGHEKQKFIDGALSMEFPKSLAEEVFQLIEPFAGYAFNKAHSVSYAMIAYWTAYLKANYPEEYMASLMNSHLGQADKISGDTAECLRLGIPVLLPDINRSAANFSIDVNHEGQNAIRIGMACVKHVGEQAITSLIDERTSNGIYTSIEDLCRRGNLSNVNRRAMESLIRVGTLDSLSPRGPTLASIDRIMATAQRESELRDSGQTNMFDLFGESVKMPMENLQLDHGEILHKELMEWEKELLGTWITNNPLTAAAYSAPNNCIISREDIESEMIGKSLNLVGQVSSINQRTTREGKAFIILDLALMVGNITVIVWPNIYDRTQDIWYEGNLVELVGKLRSREDELSIHCDEVVEYSPERSMPSNEISATSELQENTINNKSLHTNGVNKHPENSLSNTELLENPSPKSNDIKLWIHIEESDDPTEDEQKLRDIVRLLLNHRGNSPTALVIKTNGKTVKGDLPFASVSYCEQLHSELAQLVGNESIKVERE